jgi:hypothetical protein
MHEESPVLSIDRVLRLPASADVKASLLMDERRFPLVQSDDDLSTLAALGTEAFGDAGPGRYGLGRVDFYRRILGCNPRVSRFLLESADAPKSASNAVGFVCVLPLRKSASSAIASGGLSQFELTASNIVAPGATTERDLYVQGVYLRPAKRFLFRELFHCWTRVMADLVVSGADPVAPLIFGEETTALGQRTRMNLGWTPFGISKDGNTLVCSRPEHEEMPDAFLSGNRRLMIALIRSYAARQVNKERD